MEDVVNEQFRQDYLDVATIIQQFLDGTGDRWAWDDFVSKRRFKDPYLDDVKRQCDAMSWRYPSDQLGRYCNDDGLFLLQGIANELRAKASSTVGSSSHGN